VGLAPEQGGAPGLAAGRRREGAQAVDLAEAVAQLSGRSAGLLLEGPGHVAAEEANARGARAHEEIEHGGLVAELPCGVVGVAVAAGEARERLPIAGGEVGLDGRPVSALELDGGAGPGPVGAEELHGDDIEPVQAPGAGEPAEGVDL